MGTISTPDAATRNRYTHLDGLRGLAALDVMLGHALQAYDFALYTGMKSDSHLPWDITVSAWPLLLPLAGTNFAVCVFFALSGFVLAHALTQARIGAPALAAKRAVRLGVPILAATLFGWALLAAGGGFNHVVAPMFKSKWLADQWTQAPNLAEAARDGLYGNLVGRSSSPASYDFTLWTMPIEFFGSLLLIVCFSGGKWGRRFGLTRRSGALALLLVGLLCYPLYGSLIVCGAALYLLEPRRFLEKRHPNRVLLLSLLAASLFLGTVPYSVARGPWWDALVSLAPDFAFNSAIVHWIGLPGFMPMGPVVLFHALGAVLLLTVVEIWPEARRVLDRRLPQYLGRISFPLYLVHGPVLLSVGCGAFLLAGRAGIAPDAALAVAAGCFGGVSLALAGFASRFVDRPATQLAAWAGRNVQHLVDLLIRLPSLTRKAHMPPPTERSVR